MNTTVQQILQQRKQDEAMQSWRGKLMWLLSWPKRALVSLFHPPLPPLMDVAQSDLIQAQTEIETAQREILRLRYQIETRQGVVDTNRRRIRRIERDLELLHAHGSLDAPAPVLRSLYGTDMS